MNQADQDDLELNDRLVRTSTVGTSDNLPMRGALPKLPIHIK